VHIDQPSGTEALSIAANSYQELDTTIYPNYNYNVFCLVGQANTDNFPVQAVVEPIYTLAEAEAGRCPLNYTLQATDDRPRRLVGTFIGLDGRELRSNETQPMASFSIPITNSAPLPLGYWYMNRHGSPSSERLWADVAVFRGILYGGPVKCIPGGRNATASAAVDGYTPQAGAILLRPGPVVLGGPDLTWQPASNPGFYDIPISTTEHTLVSGTVTFEVDVTSSVAATLFVNWTGASSTLRVQAARKVISLEGSPQTSWTGTVYTVDETFGVPADDTVAAYVELDQGLWSVKLTQASGTVGGLKTLLQRWQ